jgi:hypothetical protein
MNTTTHLATIPVSGGVISIQVCARSETVRLAYRQPNGGTYWLTEPEQPTVRVMASLMEAISFFDEHLVADKVLQRTFSASRKKRLPESLEWREMIFKRELGQISGSAQDAVAAL